MKNVGPYFRPGRPPVKSGFSQRCTWALFLPSAYVFEASFRVIPGKQTGIQIVSKHGNANTDTAAAHSTPHAVIATPSPSYSYSRLVEYEPKATGLLTCTTTPATLAVLRGIPLVWLSGVPLYELEKSTHPSTYSDDRVRPCNEQAHTTQRKKNTHTQHNTAHRPAASQRASHSPNSRWKALTRWLLPRRVLRSES